MSETEDDQSIISHHCAMMILPLDTKEYITFKTSECKALFFIVAVSGLRTHRKICIAKRRSLFQKIQSQGPDMFFRK